ncbi:unnamed protein product, partial [Brassica oleracea]
YIVVLIQYQGRYMFKSERSPLARAKAYKTNDETGLMWDKAPEDSCFIH